MIYAVSGIAMINATIVLITGALASLAVLTIAPTPLIYLAAFVVLTPILGIALWRASSLLVALIAAFHFRRGHGGEPRTNESDEARSFGERDAGSLPRAPSALRLRGRLTARRSH